MPIQLNSSGWRIKATSRGATRDVVDVALPSLPPEFLTTESRLAEEVVLEPGLQTRGQEASSEGLDFSYDLEPGQTAILGIRHPSGALTFHRPVMQSKSRGLRGPSQVRFVVTVQRNTTRGVVAKAIKAIVIKVAEVAAEKAVSLVLPKLVEVFERNLWKKRGLREGWLKLTKETLATGKLEFSTPASPDRSLLLIHGTFSNTAAAYRDLAKSNFFERVKDTYDDRIFAFDHFSLSRTPEENARMFLEALPEQRTTFDVITHSRGGLVLRNLVERVTKLGDLAHRFQLGRAILVAAPNEGTPLATPKRWDDTVGWLANLLEMFPENPFTTGAAFVANGLVWLATHASGDIPGLHSMDAEGDLIKAIQDPPGPPAGAYSALVANYQPTDAMLQRFIDAGIDQFFGSANDLVVPSEGGWRIDRSSSTFIPGNRIGCFGPGGNLPIDSVTHVSFFSHAETVDFLVNALSGRQQPLNAVDATKPLPDRKLLRGSTIGGAAIRPMGKVAAVTAPRAARRSGEAGGTTALHITVTNGDLTFEPEALLLGHYRATRLTGTEKVMDSLIGGAMHHSLEMGVYPMAVSSHQIFINTRPNYERGSFMPRPKAVIVVGLGEEGGLKAGDLVHSVRQAAIAWAQRLVEDTQRSAKKVKRPVAFELAATLLGSGGTSVTAGEAARLIAQGIYEANTLLQDENDDGVRWPWIRHLHFIELYLDRATEAWRALKLQEAATTGRYVIDATVHRRTGALQRPPDSGYRGADYDFITVETKMETGGTTSIYYTLDTKRARSEVRAQRPQSKLLRELVATASTDQNRDDQIGRTLFNLLVPIELEAYLTGSGEMQIALDPATAGIPWELLDTKGDNDAELPWAVRINLLRKLRIQRFREQVADPDAEASALVIGEPQCPEGYPRLYGARTEALAVRSCLAAALDRKTVTALISDKPSQVGANARTVVNALFEKPWRIVHIAGHGMPGSSGSAGGVVLSTDKTFLGPAEIRSMRTVPELVFVNCCYLASGDPNQLLNYDRAAFASGIAGALIEIGVRCVIAAGWAVDDDAATAFAETFYASLLRGNRFIVAVGEARRTTYEKYPHVNTWAAYQCYGDPDWVFQRNSADPNQATIPFAEDLSSVASATSLKLTLERIIVQTKFQGADPVTQVERLRKLENAFEEQWGGNGDVAELLGEAFVEAGSVEKGMNWYERAVGAPDGRASMKAAEQLANSRSRLGWEIVDKAFSHRDAMATRERDRGLTVKVRAAARLARIEAERVLRSAAERADDLIAQSLRLLAKLSAVEETMERANLVGSAYKRKALVDAAAGRKQNMQRNLEQMKKHYQHAWNVGLKSRTSDLYYPVSNCLVADVALNAGTPRWRTLDQKTVAIVRQSLKAKNESEPDFWSVVGDIELRQYEALAKRKLAAFGEKLNKDYEDLHKRVTSMRMWASVYDTACLVLLNYADRVSRTSSKEKEMAITLLALLRAFAHPAQEGTLGNS